MAEKQACSLCGEHIEDEPAIHDPDKCAATELLKGRKKIKELKASIESWKEAWYHYREIVGEMAWQHTDYTCPYERKYPMLEKLIDVYVDGRLVGAGRTPEAVEAIKRLMSFVPSPETIALVNRMQENKGK